MAPPPRRGSPLGQWPLRAARRMVVQEAVRQWELPSWRASTAFPGAAPNAVARPRLDERLNAALCSRLTVLSAPAGFGKTTLLTEWLATLGPGATCGRVALAGRARQRRRAVLDVRRHRDRQGGRGRRRERALQLLDASPPSTEAALAALLNDLGGLPEDLLLVLDDYHLVEAADVHEGMTFLLEHQPPQLHVVLATRTDPPLPLARMRARGQLSEVRAADLRFTVEESAAYLNDGDGPPAQRGRRGGAGRAYRRVDRGPAAGRAVDAGPRATSSAFIAGFAGDDRYVVDYLGEEVLARQPADVRDFLLQTSILERLTGPLCDAVTGRRRRQGDPGGARARQPLRRPARRPAAVVPLPPPVRRRPPRAPARRARPSEVPELHAPGQRLVRGQRRQLAGDRATRWPAATSTEPPTSWSSPCRRCSGTGGRPSSPAGCARCPTTWCGAGRCSASASSLRWRRCRTSTPSAERLSDVERSLRAEDGSWPAAAAAGPHRRRPGRLPVTPRPDPPVPGRPGSRRRGPRRHGHAGAGSDVARPAGRRPHPRLGKRPGRVSRR